jgi:hypothetical protein
VKLDLKKFFQDIFGSDPTFQEADPQIVAIKARKLEDFRYLHLLDKFRH